MKEEKSARRDDGWEDELNKRKGRMGGGREGEERDMEVMVARKGTED